jgi:hypothetical protein
MFEHRAAWSAKPLDDGSMPESTVAWLKDAAAALKAAGFAPRVQLVRQPSRANDERALFVQLARAGTVELYGFAGVPGRMPDVDLARLASEPSAFDAYRLDTPHYFVCTNGQRDLCCARFGLPVFNALAERVGERAWQTTHVGGHRFAPNVLVLPAGALYGRVAMNRVAELIDTTERGHLVADLLRGRSWRQPAVQAAEAFLYREAGDVPNGPVEVTERADVVTTRFVETDWEVVVRALTTERIASCGDEKPKPTREYELVGCRRISAP